MDLSIIIVNYRSKNKLVNCLNSINSADLSGLSYEVLVVDNDSGDDLSDLKYPWLRIINSGANLGMGKGNNFGIAQSSGAQILISNPDIVFTPDAIKKLYYYLKANPKVGLVGPKLLNPDGSLQYSCVRFPKFYTPLLRRTFVGQFFPGRINHYLMKHADHNQTQVVDWILGACFMVRRSEIKDNLLFDERYFMYFEDVDLCRQIRTRGQKVVYFPAAEVTHNHLRQSAQRPWYQSLLKDKIAREHLKSAFRYFIKWRKS
ncbi:MAG: glycosyltransferase family 2 protein [Patescibacteria group bacterium]|jgi:N-acetylglucosaminyl-diphospho-decaprenol L-rhamnosyltransferase